jgi:hypothetical protein
VTDLQHALRRATDHLEAPDLAPRALAGARRRRRARGTVAAVVLVALAGGGVAWEVQRPSGEAAVVDAPTPVRLPTSTPTAVETDEAMMGTQPLWDPFTVVDAPRGSTVLPERLVPPSDAASLFESPLPAAVLAWPEEGQALRLLGSDGQWRSVPGTESVAPSALRDVASPALSSDGRLVAFSSAAGLWVLDVAAGERRILPWPDEIAGAWDTPPGVLWMPGDEEVLVLHWSTPWVMGLDGTGADASYLGGYAGGVAVDPGGALWQRRFQTGKLVEWRDGEVEGRVDDGGIAWGERMVAGRGMVAITGGLGGGAFAGPIVVDTATGDRVAYAPVDDRDSVYADNGFLTAQGFLDEDTVLLLVGPMDFRTMDIGDERWHLVAWHFRTGDFELLASGDTRMRSISVAPDLVAD